MKIGFYSYYDAYNHNQMFSESFKSQIGDDLNYPLRYLYQFCKEKGINISTIDTGNLDDYNAIVFLDYPGNTNKYFQYLIRNNFENLFLILFENEVIRPDNWNRENHIPFKKVFTWNGNYVDGNKYSKYYLPNRILPVELSGITQFSEKNFCTMIAGNKKVEHPDELYSERIRCIQWYEINQPREFDLYGIGWNEEKFYGKLSFLNTIQWIKDLRFRPLKTYKGQVESKKEVLKKYKFSICYENAQNISGYISEKIFDCLFSGCIPVYLGAPYIYEEIPKDTFIHKENFKDYESLNSFLHSMSEEEYMGYIDNIIQYTHSEKIERFSAENFANTIIGNILSSI